MYHYWNVWLIMSWTYVPYCVHCQLIYGNTKCIECAILERRGRRGVSSLSVTTSAVVWRVGTFPKGSALTTGGDATVVKNTKCAERAILERPGRRGASSSSLTTSAAEWRAGTLPKGSAVTTRGDVAVLSVEEAQRNKGAN
ncbi:hypothetical protein BU17DRAFT_69371 [Hysterangium stoloniferum]|nr:hypothetical protein BU17DRAFT_69371 [Hysterangium stoloniferum]